jgi:hypothetical protein
MYVVRVLERDLDTNNSIVIFTKKILQVPLKQEEYNTEKEFSDYIRSLNYTWYIRDTYLAQLHYICYTWFPKNFYTIKWED